MYNFITDNGPDHRCSLCDFDTSGEIGHICGEFVVPTQNRKLWLQQVTQYVTGEIGHECGPQSKCGEEEEEGE